MMKNKRLFAILTLVCFMFTFMPVAAFAEEETVEVWGGQPLASLDGIEVTTEGELCYTVKTPAEFLTVVKKAEDGPSLNGNMTIVLPKNATWDLTNWPEPVKVDGYHGADIITIEANGTTFVNMQTPLFAGGFAGGSGIVIQNLTIANSKIVSTNTIGSGAFIESVDSMAKIELKNCHLYQFYVFLIRRGHAIKLLGYQKV